jgi:hypothetical protein
MSLKTQNPYSKKLIHFKNGVIEVATDWMIVPLITDGQHSTSNDQFTSPERLKSMYIN